MLLSFLDFPILVHIFKQAIRFITALISHSIFRTAVGLYCRTVGETGGAPMRVAGGSVWPPTGHTVSVLAQGLEN